MELVKRKVPAKKYVILLIVFLVTVVLTLYINAWALAYKEERFSISPLSGVVDEVDLNQVSTAISERNEVMLYLGYTKSVNLYNAEEKMLDYLKKHEIVDKMIYVNVNDYMDQYKDILKTTFDIKVKNVPVLIYLKNGEVKEVVKSKDGVISKSDISYLNQKYELE